MSKPRILGLAALTLIVVVVCSYLFSKRALINKVIHLPSPKEGVERFTSEEEFKSYLSQAAYMQDFLMSPRGAGVSEWLAIPSVGLDQTAEKFPQAPEQRVSETNVQVLGIDEPDIVKTDGTNIFISAEAATYPRPLLMEGSTSTGLIPPPYLAAKVKVVAAYPPSALNLASTIEKGGNLLLKDHLLIVFSDNEIAGFDVTDAASPTKKWSFTLDSRNYIVASRLFEGELFVVTRTSIDRGKPCPVPLDSQANFSVACSDIFHPSRPFAVDSTYTTFEIDPATGAVGGKISFVGSSGSTVTYMSPEAIYVTYTYEGNMFSFLYGFYNSEGRDLISDAAFSKLALLDKYDISDIAKMTELSLIIQGYQNSLTPDEARRIQNELANRLTDYSQKHARELEMSGIVKVSPDTLSITSTGTVPGRPLNQFSLDEYLGNLRVATTVDTTRFGGTSESDVYVLDDKLTQVGSVTGLGQGETIYSARFIAGNAYVVTFKKTDPFYVIDLSNPSRPSVVGQLKIPGYSSYLHPISEGRILGIGEEDNKVKISFFDVSKPSQPLEVSKYNLDEYWSDVLNTHHAFLLDEKHAVFFLPAATGGYVFSYNNDALSLVRVVSDLSARRAIYIGDYLYVISDDKMVVLDENSWNQVASLSY